MVFRRDIVAGDEDAPPLVRNLAAAFQVSLLGYLAHQLFSVEALPLRDFNEVGIGLDEFGAVHHVLDVDDREQRLDAGAGAGNHGDSAGWRDSSAGGIAVFLVAAGPDASLPERERAALFAQFEARGVAFRLDKLHHPAGQLNRFRGIVGDFPLEEHIRPTHDA